MQFRSSDHQNPKDSQVFIAITGTPEGIYEQLKNIVSDIEKYKKPMQGIRICHNNTAEIITPVYRSIEY